MSANQPSKNEQVASQWIVEQFGPRWAATRGPGEHTDRTKSLAALLDRTEAEAREPFEHAIEEIHDAVDLNQLHEDARTIGGFLGGENVFRVVPIMRERIEALRAQVAELKRQRDMLREDLHAARGMECCKTPRHEQAKSALAASRIEAARLHQVLSEVRDSDLVAWGGGPCGWPGGPNPHREDCDDPEMCARLHRVWSVLAATSESAAAWLAEVQRKALERAAQTAIDFDSHKTCEPMCGCSEDIADRIRGLIPEPKEPTP